jgi:hypothetical protein
MTPRIGRPRSAVPAVSNVGHPFFIVALGFFHGTKSVCLIEAPGSDIALKRPEVKASGKEPFGLVEESRAGSATDVPGIDVELIDPAVTDRHHPNDFDLVFDHPRCSTGYQHVEDPPPDVFVGMDRLGN